MFFFSFNYQWGQEKDILSQMCNVIWISCFIILKLNTQDPIIQFIIIKLKTQVHVIQFISEVRAIFIIHILFLQ